MRGVLGRLFTESEPRRVHECRRCGEAVSSETTHCPACGHDGISVHDVR